MSGMPNATAQLAEIVKLLVRLWLFEVNQSTLESMCGSEFREPYESLGGELTDVVSPELDEDGTARRFDHVAGGGFLVDSRNWNHRSNPITKCWKMA